MTPEESIKSLQEVGWSHREIAEAVGVAQSTITRIAKGDVSRPNYEVVDKLREVVEDVEGFDVCQQ